MPPPGTPGQFASWQSIINQSAVKQYDYLDFGIGVCHNQFGLQVLSGAGVSGGVVALLGSLDGQNYFATGVTITTNAAGTLFYASSASATPLVFRFIAASITTVITGGTVNAWIAGSG